jgi:hypothetical protein
MKTETEKETDSCHLILKHKFQLKLDDLHDQQLVFTSKSKCQLTSGNRSYETVVSKKKSSLSLLLPNSKGKLKPGKKAL